LDAADPSVMFTAPELAQVKTLFPAFDDGAVTMVNVFVEAALPQGVLPVAVRVRVTLPAEMSAVLGVYVQVVKELAFAKVPVPLDVQVAEE